MDQNVYTNAAPANIDAEAHLDSHACPGAAAGPTAEAHPATAANRVASRHRTTAGPTIADVGSTTDANSHRVVSVMASPWQFDV